EAAGEPAHALQIALHVDRRCVSADLHLHQPAVRSPCPFDRMRAKPGADELLDEEVGALATLEGRDENRVVIVRGRSGRARRGRGCRARPFWLRWRKRRIIHGHWQRHRGWTERDTWWRRNHRRELLTVDRRFLGEPGRGAGRDGDGEPRGSADDDRGCQP